MEEDTNCLEAENKIPHPSQRETPCDRPHFRAELAFDATDAPVVPRTHRHPVGALEAVRTRLGSRRVALKPDRLLAKPVAVLNRECAILRVEARA